MIDHRVQQDMEPAAEHRRDDELPFRGVVSRDENTRETDEETPAMVEPDSHHRADHCGAEKCMRVSVKGVTQREGQHQKRLDIDRHVRKQERRHIDVPLQGQRDGGARTEMEWREGHLDGVLSFREEDGTRASIGQEGYWKAIACWYLSP